MMAIVIGWALGVLLTAVAAKAAVVVWQQSRRPRVVCLMYHRIASRQKCEGIRGSDRNYTLPAEELEKQIEHLQQRGFRFLTPEEASRFARKEWELEQPGVVLTFDDGCQSVYETAMPILARHGVPATAFVTTDPDSYVFGYGQPRMTDEELRGLELAGIRCESHSMTHRPLVQLSDTEIREELGGSKRELEQVLGREVKVLSAPGNWINGRVVRLAKECGYEAIWISEPGSVRPGSNLFGLPRLNVDGAITLDEFAALLTPWGVAQRHLVYVAKTCIKRVSGPHLWYRLRSVLLRCMPGGYVSFSRWRVILTVPVIFLALVALFRALS